MQGRLIAYMLFSHLKPPFSAAKSSAKSEYDSPREGLTVKGNSWKRQDCSLCNPISYRTLADAEQIHIQCFTMRYRSARSVQVRWLVQFVICEPVIFDRRYNTYTSIIDWLHHNKSHATDVRQVIFWQNLVCAGHAPQSGFELIAQDDRHLIMYEP